MGCGISDLTIGGEWRALDLTLIDNGRLEQNRPFNEQAII
jgi:hypothetical protein